MLKVEIAIGLAYHSVWLYRVRSATTTSPTLSAMPSTHDALTLSCPLVSQE